MCWSVKLIATFKIPHRRPEWHLQKETFRWLHKQGNHHQSEMSQSFLLQIQILLQIQMQIRLQTQRTKVSKSPTQAAKLKKKKKVKVKNQKKVKIRKGTKPYIRRKWFLLHLFFFFISRKGKLMKGIELYKRENPSSLFCLFTFRKVKIKGKDFLYFFSWEKWRWGRGPNQKPKSSGESEAFLTFPSQRHKPFIKRKGVLPFPILYFNIKIKKKGNQKDFVFVFAFVFRSIRRFGLQEELIIILNIFCLQSSINLFQSERFVFILTIFLRSMEAAEWLKHTHIKLS